MTKGELAERTILSRGAEQERQLPPCLPSSKAPAPRWLVMSGLERAVGHPERLGGCVFKGRPVCGSVGGWVTPRARV
jgi:hypothetical protein